MTLAPSIEAVHLPFVSNFSPVGKSMLAKAREIISKMVKADQRVLVACSGGLDSTVLLHLLRALKVNAAVAHVNFGLRGAEADGDQAWLQELCKEWGIPFFGRKMPASEEAKRRGISTQMAARDLRYGFFKELCQSEGFQWLATAHHLDDSLETMLINFGRGTGLAGLRGVPGDSPGFLRPLLFHGRSEIEAYAQAQELKWREDSSNAQEAYLRNALRHRVVPAWKEAEPRLKKGARESFEQLGRQYGAFQALLREKLATHLQSGSDESWLLLKDLPHKDYWADLLYCWLQPLGSFDWASLAELDVTENGQLFESEDHQLLHDRGRLILRKHNSAGFAQELKLEKEQQELRGPVALTMSFHDDPAELPGKDADSACLDADKLQWPLILRKWRPGDRFQPLGMKGKKKLSDFFVDQKMSRFDKENQWLLCSGPDIVWVLGRRIDERYKCGDWTKTVYFVHILKDNP